MTAADNRFNPDFCASLSSALDHVSAQISSNSTNKYALIVTGTGKYFSNGLDLKYLMTQADPNQFLINHYEPLINKFLTFPLPTLAYMNGHAFAGGMCLALALDYRVATRSEKPPLLSMNELLIRASIPAGMLSVLQAKLPSPQLLRDCIFAERWNTLEAHQNGIIDLILPNFEQVIKLAKAKAIESKLSPVLESIKLETYKNASETLLNPKSDKLDPFRFAMPKSKF